jgi:subtilisin-like proprotein convertase family protein
VPSPALTKAIMVNTATDQVGGNNGAGGTNANIPTQIQGWGRINLGNVVDGTSRQFVDQTSRFATSGQSHRRTFAVASLARPLKLTLAWTDAPGPLTGNAFVNDLDLVVHAGGSTYKGNVLANGQSVTGGSADARNNVENVFLPAGTSGRFAVDVRATNVAGDGVPGNADATDQDYALVVSNANPSAGPVLVHDLATTTEIGDGDGQIEPGEQFRLRERLRNLGTGTASGINSTLSAAAPRITVPAAASTYPNILANGVGLNNSQFRVRLANNFVCGETARLSLAVTTGQGNFQIPISVPTGSGTSPPTNVNSTDVPKAIPTLGTVTSTLSIAGAGAIQDLDVRIPNLTHTFDGDLEITLFAPGGSPSVTLVNNRGGSGDNFTNTVFDDEAATAISAGAAPFTGSFRPESPLSVFDGISQAGTWTLRIEDQVSGDSGTLNAWGVRKTLRICS